MANIESEFITYLLGGTSPINGDVGSRIYPQRIKQNSTFPACVYQFVSQSPVVSHSGYSGITTGIVQLDIYGSTYSQIKTVRDNLNSINGTKINFATFSGVFININQQDIFEDDEGLHRQIYEIQLKHND